MNNIIFALGIGLAGPSAWAQSDIPAIAAASDLKFALEDIAVRFRNDTLRNVRLSFGSSGNYFRQIAEGAPFQMFLSADEGFVFRLHEAGKTEDRGVLYAVGRIVLFAPAGSSLKVDAGAAGLKAALAAKRISRFAMANPEHAPYGRAAEEALRTLGLWDALKGKLVLGENVSQAAQFAASGSAQGGIFAYSLALSPNVSKLGQYALLPAELHKPLRQQMVLVKGAGETARAFYTYLQQPAARTILTQYGFALPAESKK
ncbi:MAG: molybdate ABC transporter substrate-binding protein [Burkholderiales bacterium]|nr:molybdate ABC transporter substrate-binding protein [Burkholderiales bacterium]